MKKLANLTLVALIILAFSGFAMAQEPPEDYKLRYEKQMKVNTETMDVINGVVKWLKEHNYEKYPMAKMRVEDAFDQLAFAEKTKKRAEEFAAKGVWKMAHGWAIQYWQYLVKVADSGLRAKQMVKEEIAKAK